MRDGVRMSVSLSVSLSVFCCVLLNSCRSTISVEAPGPPRDKPGVTVASAVAAASEQRGQSLREGSDEAVLGRVQVFEGELRTQMLLTSNSGNDVTNVQLAGKVGNSNSSNSSRSSSTTTTTAAGSTNETTISAGESRQKGTGMVIEALAPAQTTPMTSPPSPAPPPPSLSSSFPTASLSQSPLAPAQAAEPPPPEPEEQGPTVTLPSKPAASRASSTPAHSPSVPSQPEGASLTGEPAPLPNVLFQDLPRAHLQVLAPICEAGGSLASPSPPSSLDTANPSSPPTPSPSPCPHFRTCGPLTQLQGFATCHMTVADWGGLDAAAQSGDTPVHKEGAMPVDDTQGTAEGLDLGLPEWGPPVPLPCALQQRLHDGDSLHCHNWLQLPLPPTAPQGAAATAAAASASAGSTSKEGASGLHSSSQRAGAWSDGRAMGTVFRLSNVYMNYRGRVFNESLIVNPRGCAGSWKDEMLNGTMVPTGYFPPTPAEVVRVRGRTFGLMYEWLDNFYHGFVEFLPTFLALAPFLREEGGGDIIVPIQCRKDHLRHHIGMYRGLMKQVLGTELTPPLRLTCIKRHQILLAEELIQPIYPNCAEPSEEWLHELRRRFYLRPDGLPFFEGRWAVRGRGQAPLSAAQMALAAVPPARRVAILCKRDGDGKKGSGRRGLEQWDDVLREMGQVFGSERVHVFDGKVELREAKQLFNRAALFVAGHGAGLSNMVFMPTGARVLEIRPCKWDVPLYGKMAVRSGLKFHLVHANGTWGGTVNVDMRDVSRELAAIADQRLFE